ECVTSKVAICQPVLFRRCVVRAALVFAHRRVPLWFLLLFRLRFSSLFFVTGFPAVGDLGQGLAEMFYLGFSPEMYGHATARGCLGFWDFASLDIAAQGHGSDAKFLSCLVRGKGLHSDEI